MSRSSRIRSSSLMAVSRKPNVVRHQAPVRALTATAAASGSDAGLELAIPAGPGRAVPRTAFTSPTVLEPGWRPLAGAHLPRPPQRRPGRWLTPDSTGWGRQPGRRFTDQPLASGARRQSDSLVIPAQRGALRGSFWAALTQWETGFDAGCRSYASSGATKTGSMGTAEAASLSLSARRRPRTVTEPGCGSIGSRSVIPSTSIRSRIQG